jgi:hypothetical protein
MIVPRRSVSAWVVGLNDLRTGFTADGGAAGAVSNSQPQACPNPSDAHPQLFALGVCAPRWLVDCVGGVVGADRVGEGA